MFVIPAGMWMGAPVSMHAWWLWNQIPVTLGNLAGGALFVGLPMLLMSNVKGAKSAEVAPVHPAAAIAHSRSDAVEA
jgi:formate/nitrite transporter FocA (FNT family)